MDASPGQFYGVWVPRPLNGKGHRLAAVGYLGESGLLVPEGRSIPALEQLADLVAGQWRKVDVLVGPQLPVELIWQRCHRWGVDPPPRLWRIHQLFRLAPIDLVPGPEEVELRLAEAEDLDELTRASAAMRNEELGEDILRTQGELFRQCVQERIELGTSWIVRDRQGIAFKVDVGTLCEHGAQLEGVYTRPDRRGAGLASRSLRRLCRLLFQEVRRISLHVWNENRSAVSSYRRVGFQAHSTYRIVLR